MTITPETIELLKRLEAAATPGTWELWNGCSWWRIGLTSHNGRQVALIEPCNDRSDGHPNLTGPNLKNDLEAAIAARNHLRELIEWGEGLERDVSDLAQMDVENAATIESLHNQLDEANEEIARLRGVIE